MNASSQAHEEAQELLPWLANGSLGGTERERVQAHLQVCAACRAELSALHTLRAAGPATVPGLDAEAALARLLPQLDAPAPVLPAPVSAADPVLPGWRARLAANDRSWLRAAVALQFGAIAVLGALLARPGTSQQAPADAYRLLGAADGVRGSLVVAFSPDTPEREVRRIVLASGARVVGGPTATGAWLLDTGDAPAAVVAHLRAERAVTLAEALGGAEGRP
jgi:hypothetical protein